MSRRVAARRRGRVEDATTQGGWLFADSFLALMVIFLATISFVPSLSNSKVTEPPSSAAGSNGNFANAFVMIFDKYDEVRIQTELNKFIQKEGLPSNSRVLYAEILGGYKVGTEVEYDGNLRALAFGIQLKQANMAQFTSATINVGATSSVGPEQVLMRLTLAKM